MRSGAGLLLALGAAGVLLLRLLLVLPRRARRALPAEGKAVLITGCDKGFGHALAKCLHAKGFTVFAGCLLMDENGDGARELRNMKSDRMKVLQMDVCSDQEVAQAVDFVKRTLKEPEEGLWGLVNNAGISTFGEVEFASLDNYKKVAEVNLWGTVRVTKAFLPLIRRAKGMVGEAFFWYLLMKSTIIRLSLMKELPPSDSFKPEGINMEKESEVFWLFGTITVFKSEDF